MKHRIILINQTWGIFMDFNEVLKKRRSCRKFGNGQIAKAELDEILLAGINSPVGSNLCRDVHITVVQDKNVLEALCAASNKRLQDRVTLKKLTEEIDSEKDTPTMVPFYGAPAVIIVSHRKQDLQPGIEYANVTSVVHTMHLAATNIGLGSVYVWGILEAMRLFPELDNSALLNLPDGFSPLMGLMVGYPVKPPPERELKKDKIAVNYI
jgi:nitroreductase